VVKQSEKEQRFAKEYDFWSQFTIDEDLIPSKMVPQADNLETLHHAVVGVYKGHQFKPELAEWLTQQTETEWTRRQADYYAIAAYALGLLDVDTGTYTVRDTQHKVRKWILSMEGEKYVNMYHNGTDDAERYLYELIDELEIMQLVTEQVGEEIAIFQSEIADLIREHTQVSGTTADRRARTIGRWIEQKDGPIKRIEKGGNIKYANQTTISGDFN